MEIATAGGRVQRIIVPKKPKEVQIHIAVTLIGDRLSVIPQEREDVEVGQWAARFLEKDFGRIRTVELEKSFMEFYSIVLDTFRKLGVLRNGE